MDNLLTPVSTFYKKSTESSEEFLTKVPKNSETVTQSSSRLSTPEDALEVLRAEPSLDTLRSALHYLTSESFGSDFKITFPSPTSAQIINVIVLEIVPNYWAILSEASSNSGRKTSKYAREKKLLLSCLRSVSGLNAILIRVKALLQQARDSKKDRVQNLVELLKVQLDVLEVLLRGDQLLSLLWHDAKSLTPVARQRALWQEITSLLGGGKLLNGVAEATRVIKDSSSQAEESKWIADGLLYSRWLTRNVIDLSKASKSLSDGPWNPVPEILSKCFRLGYPDAAIDEVLRLLLGTDENHRFFKIILNGLPSSDQRLVLYAALKTISSYYLREAAVSNDSSWWETDASVVSAAAGYLNLLVEGDENRKTQLIDWLTSVSGAGTGESVGIRRAAVAVLSKSKYDAAIVLERTLKQFGDPLYIRHAPSLQQEVHTQVLLLSAGYVQRLAPLKISTMHGSSIYLNAVSNRLASSSPRARFLGMLVGEALSQLAEKSDKQMKFELEELESTEAQWYKSLTKVNDSIGKLDLLKVGSLSHVQKIKGKNNKTLQINTAPERQSKIISIEEVEEDDASGGDDFNLHAQPNDGDDDDEEDLPRYEKPDSDEEDSDEDPTLVQRNKPTAPVYIRDLITYLRDRENYDRQKLALYSGPSLIRRKANFGTEVSDHVEELATLLVGLQDKYDIENFQDMRIQGMIAVLTSQPAKMAKWFSKTFFRGDYSLSQRASILTVLSMSARELGGYKEQDKSVTGIKPLPENAFPSKLLPPRLHKIYATEQQLRQNPVDALSKQLSDTMIQPLAASLADKASGPDILKVRTFSSRLAVESRRKPPSANTLSSIVADSFFFPLTGHFFSHFKAYGGQKNIIFEPYLLTQLLKSLSLILHASGTSTLQLPQMTSEMWDLLLGLRMHGQNDKSIGEAMLFAFLTLLEINVDQRRLAEGHGRELIETQRWVEGFFERTGQGSEEDDRVRALAAGVLFKIQEVVERYQALLVGNVGSL